ncbi:hypothetical protein H7R52_07135 [Weissella confusa]|uniref:Amino acid permease/ SLC12A domain-containing protein n=1 Tax=Weissella confusa TaxID=1583 RepID=A0A923NEK3_WEICO|nr:hypothetical protein [Weissella confusa]
MADKNAAPDSLNRGLSKRHVTMIAIGGTIGTGLFLGAGDSTIKKPSNFTVGWFLSFKTNQALNVSFEYIHLTIHIPQKHARIFKKECKKIHRCAMILLVAIKGLPFERDAC